MGKYLLPPGITKVCAGIVEGAGELEPYASYIKRAECAIGATYSADPAAQSERAQLVKAVKYNLVNRREYPYELLARKYGLPMSLSSFKREKCKFCFELARLCGFVE